MKIHDQAFLWSVNHANPTLDERTKGKWLIYGPYDLLQRNFAATDALVEGRFVYRAKLSIPDVPENPLPGMPPVLVVYADDATRYRTLDLLLLNGIVPSGWKYNWETRRDWDAGGPLRELHRRLAPDDVTLPCKEVLE